MDKRLKKWKESNWKDSFYFYSRLSIELIPPVTRTDIAVEEEGVVFANMIDLIYKIVPLLGMSHNVWLV